MATTSLGTFIERELRTVWNKYVRNSSESWNKVYSRNYVDKLESLDQRARHYLVAGVLRDLLPPNASILDVGCGSGTTFGMLGSGYAYRGIDIAGEAIEACAGRFPEHTREFEVADFETYLLERYDAIVFNESLYYLNLSSLPALLDKCVCALKDERGLVVVSMSETVKSAMVRKRLSVFGWPVQEVKLASRAMGSSWRVGVYRPLDASARRPPPSVTRRLLADTM